MSKKEYKRLGGTKMIGRTKDGDPVWTDARKKPFLIVPTAGVGKVRKVLRLWHPLRWTYRRLPAPHLSYGQVEIAAHKSTNLLKALRNGPLIVDKGFIKNRANRLVMTRAVAEVVIHWMEGCGFVFTHEPISKNRLRLDIDVEATAANGVAGPTQKDKESFR